MIKKIIIAFIITCLYTHTHAQLKVLAKSIAFEEPDKGYAKILFMQNKNTAYVHVADNGEVTVKMYNTEHKQIFSKVSELKFGKLKWLNVRGCFEMNNNITLLLTEYPENTEVLYRIVINGSTGQLKSQEELVNYGKLTFKQDMAVKMSKLALPTYLVRKDINNEYYCTAAYNTLNKDKNVSIDVVHYNNEHEAISTSSLNFSLEKYKSVDLIDLAVIGDKEVNAIIFAQYPDSKRKGDFILASFKPNNEVTQTLLDHDPDADVSGALIKYQPKENKLYVITQNLVSVKEGFKSKLYYDIVGYVIDPKSKKSVRLPQIDLNTVNDKAISLFGEKHPYMGVLQNFYMNDDGSYTYIFEGLLTETTSSGKTTITSYTLGDIAVLNYNNQALLTSSAYIPKSQMLNTGAFTGGGGSAYPLYHYFRDYTAQYLKGGNQFKSFAYLNGKSKNYILINDIEENEENIMKGKLTTIKGVGECDAVSFICNSKEILPPRKYIFGKGEGKRDHSLAIFTISDYDRERNVYATLKLEIDGRDKKVKVVWLEPEM